MLGGDFIYSTFENLNVQKRKDIINASLNEFAKNGFDKASTNEIVKSANISKGSLFNYFLNKKDLYAYLFEFSTVAVDNLIGTIDTSESDIFNRLTNIGVQKLSLCKEYPAILTFLSVAQKDSSTDVKKITGDYFTHTYEQGFKKIYVNIDYSKFRADLEIDKCIEIINWYGNTFLDKITS